MKKIKYFALMSAIALTSAVGFTACSSSDDVSDKNPVIDSKDYGKGVTTQFALNIGSASSVTRSTANVAQNNSYFRGMEDIYLIPMNFEQTDAKKADLFSQSGYTTTIYHLGNIPNTSAMSELSTDVYKKIYSLTLPVGTNNFLFYGRATHEDKQSGDALPNDDEALNGKLTMTSISEGTTKAGDISISLNAIDATASTGEGSPRKFFADMLTEIATTKITVGETTTYWKNLDETKNKNKTLLDTYSNFTTVKTNVGELRAGSAEAIRATVQELYRTVLAQERYGEDDEVKAMAQAIREKIHTYFDVYFAAVDATTPFAGTAVASANVNTQTTPGTYNYDLDYYKPYLKLKSTDEAIYNFPTYQGLPSGAVNLQCTQSTNGCNFSYKTTSTAVLSTGNSVTNFTFPAELTYFANSALRASNYSKEANEYPVTGSWDDNTKWDTETESGTKDWAGTVITADTRAVAMKNKIFYGVSRLQSNVKLGFDSGTDLQDNRAALFNDGETANQSITINEKSFILTGILVGQQPDAVGWNFLSKDNTFNKVVYDRILPLTSNTYYTYPEYPTNAYNLSAGSYNFVTEAGTTDNYTLLLDNYDGSATGQAQEVSVALEFINNTGQDFYGRENVIPAGGTFYLVGKLKLAGTADIDFNTQYGTDKNSDYATRIPGFGIKRVFIQDHTTVARFKITTDALQKAYNSIPDLRTVQMLFGLTVDMEWRDGVTYSDVTLDE